MSKQRLAKIVTNYLLYVGAVASIALAISGVVESTHITVDWVKLLIGLALLKAIDNTADWLYTKREILKRERTNVVR